MGRLARIRLGNFGDWKALGEGLLELRLDFGPGYRIYLGRDGPRFVIVLAGVTKAVKAGTFSEQRSIGMNTKKRNRASTSDWKEYLYKRLQDPETAAGYLTACLEEGPETFLLAVRDVTEARGGVASLAKATSLNREGLYDMLSEDGNPRLSSVTTILDALGLKVEFTARERLKKAA